MLYIIYRNTLFIYIYIYIYIYTQYIFVLGMAFKLDW